MTSYGQHNQFYHSHIRPHLSFNESNNPTSRVSINRCKLVLCALCRLTCCLFLLIIEFFLFIISITILYTSFCDRQHTTNDRNIIAFILLVIAIFSCKRLCWALKQYSLIICARDQSIQRLHEQQQVYHLGLLSNNDDNPELIVSGITDLPSYQELFHSQINISNNINDPLSILPLPPSYNDFVKGLDINHPITTLPISSSLCSPVLSIPTTPLPSTSLPRCI